jgi:hypothetical protein
MFIASLLALRRYEEKGEENAQYQGSIGDNWRFGFKPRL